MGSGHWLKVAVTAGVTVLRWNNDKLKNRKWKTHFIHYIQYLNTPNPRYALRAFIDQIQFQKYILNLKEKFIILTLKDLGVLHGKLCSIQSQQSAGQTEESLSWQQCMAHNHAPISPVKNNIYRRSLKVYTVSSTWNIF